MLGHVAIRWAEARSIAWSFNNYVKDLDVQTTAGTRESEPVLRSMDLGHRHVVGWRRNINENKGHGLVLVVGHRHGW